MWTLCSEILIPPITLLDSPSMGIIILIYKFRSITILFSSYMATQWRVGVTLRLYDCVAVHSTWLGLLFGVNGTKIGKLELPSIHSTICCSFSE